MRKKMCFMICLSAFLYSAIPQSVQADTIGISPPKADVNTTLSLFDFPALITDAGVDDVRVTQTSGIDGRAITMTWNATNSGLNPLDGAFARVRVMQKEN